MLINSTAQLFGSVQIEQEVRIGPFCVIGVPAVDERSNDAIKETVIKRGTLLESHVIIGQGSNIGCGCWIDHHCYLGCDTIIGNLVEVMYAARIYHRVVVGYGAWIGGFVCNDARIEAEAIVMGRLIHRFCDVKEEEEEPAPSVGARAFIGMGASIIGGISIGEGAYIAAGAVVTDSVPPKRLYAGNPARDIGKAPIPYSKWKDIK